MELFSDGSTIFIHQNKYGDSLEIVQIKINIKNKSMSADEKQTYRLGQILWTSRQSHPDLMFDACQLAANVKNGKVEHLMEANMVIRRIKSEKVALKFYYLVSVPLKLLVYTDASFGNLNDGGTQGGFSILANEEGQTISICWNSKKIHRVVRNTLAGETLAMAERVDTAKFVSTLFTEITTEKPVPKRLSIIQRTDYKSLNDALKSTKRIKKTFEVGNHWNQRTDGKKNCERC